MTAWSLMVSPSPMVCLPLHDLLYMFTPKYMLLLTESLPQPHSSTSSGNFTSTISTTALLVDVSSSFMVAVREMTTILKL